MRKKYLIGTVIIIILLAVITAIIFLATRPNNLEELPYGNDAIVSAPVVSFPGERGRISNYEFDYSYTLPDGYLNRDIHFEDSNDSLGMQKSELIYKDVPRKVNYQIGGFYLDVYNINKLKDNNLKAWIQDQTESESTGSKLYVADSINSIRGDDIYVLVDTDIRFAGGYNPAMFIKTKDHIYVLFQNENTGLENFKNIAFSLIVGKERLRLTNEEYDLLISYITEQKTSYTFSDFPLSFEYPKRMTLKQNENKVELTYRGNTMTITPNQQGIGFEEPAPEETVYPIPSSTGEELIINNTSIKRTQLFFKEDNLYTDLIVIPYSDSQSRNYSIMINYKYKTNYSDSEATNTFDRIVSTFKVN